MLNLSIEELTALPAHHLADELRRYRADLDELCAAKAHIPDYRLLRSVEKAAQSRLDFLTAPAPRRHLGARAPLAFPLAHRLAA